MESKEYNINLKALPKTLQDELLDYYKFLLSKIDNKSDNNDRKNAFFKTVNTHQFSLPKKFNFNRDLANER